MLDGDIRLFKRVHYSASMTVSYETDLFYFANAVFAVSNSYKGKKSICTSVSMYIQMNISLLMLSQFSMKHVVYTNAYITFYVYVSQDQNTVYKNNTQPPAFRNKKVFRHLLYKTIVILSLICSIRLNNNFYGTMLFLKLERLHVMRKFYPVSGLE